MENKYYTPTIEEFHVGFEYEIKPNSEWAKETFNQFEERAYRRIYDWLNLGFVRVKNLDREDIESLGWRFIKIHAGTTDHEFEFKNYFISFDPEFGIKWNIRIYDGENQESEFNYFNGKVNNKSALKNILFQTGILY